MGTSPKRTARRAWLPRPSEVVLETTLVPGPRPGAPRLTVAAPTVYRILRTAEVDPYEKPMTRTAVAMVAARAAPPRGNTFKGTARKAAKISVARAKIERFSDLKKLIATLTDDEAMIKHDPKIGVDKNSDRVSEEKRNVRVPAFIYAASREDDNDFHLIIGRKPGLSLMFMTAELSGLPPKTSKAFARLKRSRDAYQGFFKNNTPNSGYDFYDPPIPVEIQGSLFFDMSHAKGGHPGPKKLRKNIPTIWEIHPITDIVFEPSA